MRAEHLEILVEEPSMEAFLRGLMPRLLVGTATFDVHPHQGKSDLLANLPARLRGYATWIPASWKIVVLLDRDDDDCAALKQGLETVVGKSGLVSRSVSRRWTAATRIAIEELEAWYFGDWQAVCEAYPRVPANAARRARYRIPDAIMGGTWEALERVLQNAGYFESGLRKIEVARELGLRIDPERNRSASFRAFAGVVTEAVG